jgi:hypothetical protein
MKAKSRFEIVSKTQDLKAVPPLPKLVLRIGITGHRPNNLHDEDIEAIRTRIQMVLTFIRDTLDTLQLNATDSVYSEDASVLRLISPLAEGSDRLFVEAANCLGGRFDLQCPLPFAQEEYENDFVSEQSRTQFRNFLSNATAVLELDGSPNMQRRDQAYEAVGRMVLNHSDVVIAVWDGVESNQRGGTSQMIGEATRLSVPVIWIESSGQHDVKARPSGRDEWLAWKDAVVELPKRFVTLVTPPLKAQGSGKRAKPDLRSVYFLERRRSLCLAVLWKLFVRFGAIRRTKGRVSSETQTVLPTEIAAQIDSAFGPHFESADRLATYYANVYRSAFVFNYWMSANAVLFAFMGIAAREHELARTLFGITEIAIIVGIIFVTLLGTKRRWHERGIEYRLLAEYLRQAHFLMTLGQAPVSPIRLSAQIYYGDPRNTWMYWHLRALVRQAGMIRARFDGSYLEDVKSFLHSEGLKGQMMYHEESAERFKTLNHRVHLLGIVLFILAFGAASLHLFIRGEQWPLTMLTIVGPAFGASLAAIRSQGEFERLTKRSRSTSSQLSFLAGQLEALLLRDNDLYSQKLSDIAIQSAEVMIKDVLDWRTVVRDKPLDWPS